MDEVKSGDQEEHEYGSDEDEELDEEEFEDEEDDFKEGDEEDELDGVKKEDTDQNEWSNLANKAIAQYREAKNVKVNWMKLVYGGGE